MLIGQVLVEAGYITSKQLSEALAVQERNPDKRIGEILVAFGYLSPARLEKGLALRELERELRELQTAKSSS